jgi:hypothetical protein
MNYKDFFIDGRPITIILENSAEWKIALISHVYFHSKEILYGTQISRIPWKVSVPQYKHNFGQFPLINFSVNH